MALVSLVVAASLFSEKFMGGGSLKYRKAKRAEEEALIMTPLFRTALQEIASRKASNTIVIKQVLKFI